MGAAARSLPAAEARSSYPNLRTSAGCAPQAFSQKHVPIAIQFEEQIYFFLENFVTFVAE